MNNSVYDYIPAEERSEFYNVLTSGNEGKSCNVSVVTNFRLGGLEMNEENQKYQLVKFGGYFKRWVPLSNSKHSYTSKRIRSEILSLKNRSNTLFKFLFSGYHWE